MASALSVASNIPAVLVGFDQMNQIRSYEKDGKQQTFLSACLAQRLTALDMEWSAAGFSTNAWLGTTGVTIARTLSGYDRPRPIFIKRLRRV